MNNITYSSSIPMTMVCLLLGLNLTNPGIGQNLPQEVLFYVGFEGTADGSGRQCIHANSFCSKGCPPTAFVYESGVIGQAARFTWENDYPGIRYPAANNIDPVHGTLSVWFKKTEPFFINQYVPLIWGVGWDMKDNQNALAIVPLNDPKLDVLNDHQWHHCVYTWDNTSRTRRQYLDGQLLAEAVYSPSPPSAALIFGYRWKGLLDELVILARPLTDTDVATLCQTYRRGEQPFSLPRPTRKDYDEVPAVIPTAPQDRPPLPPFVDWTLKATQTNETRALYDLSGLWRFQLFAPTPATGQAGKEVDTAPAAGIDPVEVGPRDDAPAMAIATSGPDEEAAHRLIPQASWAYVKVPDNWKKPGSVVNGDGKVLTVWGNRKIPDHRCLWYEREFTPPADWNGKRVQLLIPRIAGTARIYLNGRLIGSILTRSENHRFDLSGAMNRDGVNRLTILNGIPYMDGMEVSGFTVAPRLEVYAGTVTAGQPLINPSVRQQALRLRMPLENAGDTARDISVSARILEYCTNRVVQMLGPASVSLPARDRVETNLSFRVNDLKTWTPDEPNLYRLELVVAESGQPLDVTFPESFGFREVWVEKDTIFLNGQRLSIRGKSHEYLSGYGFNRTELRKLKAVGQNADRTAFTSPIKPEMEQTLQTTDEEGWLVFYRWSPEGARRVHNHPSVVAWQIMGDGYITGPHGHPMSLGARVPEIVKGTNENFTYVASIREKDDPRPFFYYRSGAGGDFRGIMTTLGFGTPLQDMEEWVSDWAKNRPEPFVPCEQENMPLVFESKLWQKGSNAWMILEQHARYFGEASYRQLTEPLMQAVPKGAINLDPIWFGYRNDLYALAYTRFLRSWRAYGLNGYLFHVSFKTSDLYDGEQLNAFGKALTRINMPILFYIGGPRDTFVSKDHAFFAGEAVEKSAVIVNDTFRDIAGTVSWQAATESGQKLGGASAPVTIRQGAVVFPPLRFKAPDGQAKTRIVLSAVFQEAAGSGSFTDEFHLTVFPPPTPPANIRNVALIDATGETEAVLKRMGVPCRRIDIGGRPPNAGASRSAEPPSGKAPTLAALVDDGVRLLVIGKNSYSPAAAWWATQSNAHRQVEAGLNLLILEQMNRHVAGLTVENFNTRHAFIANRSSPLLAGLTDADFQDWRGESRLLPAYPPWNPNSHWQEGRNSKHGQANSFGQGRFWHWSNKGMVATFCFQKPQRGHFNVLLSNGFDLLYTPLVEFRQGKGRALFCQLDLVDHVGVDPVATLLLKRMLEDYSRSAGPAPVAMGYVGGEKGKALLDTLAVEYQLGLNGATTLMVTGDGAGPVNAADVRHYVQEGGTLIVTPPAPPAPTRKPANPPLKQSPGTPPAADAEALSSLLAKTKDQSTSSRTESDPFYQPTTALLPVPVTVAMTNFCIVNIPNDPLFAGLSLSDLFYRQPLVLPRVGSAAGKPWPMEAISIVPCGKGRIIWMPLMPERFTDAWQRTKVLRVWSILLSNLGVASRVAPDLAQVGGYGAWEEWVPGYTPNVKDLDRRPQVKDSPLYIAPALDFDPDQHHVW